MAKKYTVIKVLFYLLLIIITYPIIASVLGFNINSTPFSIYNNGGNGLSYFASKLREDGYEIKTILSSLKILRSLNNTGVLTIIAPTIKYDIQEAIAVVDFLNRGGSVLIVDDFYASNSLLQNIWLLLSIAQLFTGQDMIFEGIYFNTTSVLMDTGSFYKTPANPVIINFNDYYGILGDNIKRILTSFPSILSLKVSLNVNGTRKEIVTSLPKEACLLYSTKDSWLETDLSSAIKGDAKPDPWEWGGVSFGIALAIELPNGGRFVMISDPDIFSNKIIKMPDFDNLAFALSIMRWLSNNGQKKLIMFDESHLPHVMYDPLLSLSVWFKLITEVSSSWIIAPFAPIIAILTLLGYVPRLKGFRPRLFSRVERVLENSWTKSRIRWYIRSRDFKQACSVIFDYLLYGIIKRYGLQEADWNELIQEFLSRRADLLVYKDRILRFMNQLYLYSIGKKKLKEDKFHEILDEYKHIKALILG